MIDWSITMAEAVASSSHEPVLSKYQVQTFLSPPRKNLHRKRQRKQGGGGGMNGPSARPLFFSSFALDYRTWVCPMKLSNTLTYLQSFTIPPTFALQHDGHTTRAPVSFTLPFPITMIDLSTMLFACWPCTFLSAAMSSPYAHGLAQMIVLLWWT